MPLRVSDQQPKIRLSRVLEASIEWTRDWGGKLTVIYGILVVLHILYVFFHWGGEDNQALTSNIVTVVIYLGPCTLAWRAFRHSSSNLRDRRAWLLISLANFSFIVGTLLWIYFENYLGEQPFPSWADVGYLSYYPLMMGGLIAMVDRGKSAQQRLGFGLDVCIILLGGALVLWYFLLAPIANAGDGYTLKTGLSLAYPVGDLVLLLGIASIILQGRRLAGNGPVNIVLVGVVLNFIADFLFGYQNVNGTYQTGDPVDAIFTIACFPIMLGAHYRYLTASSDLEDSTPDHSPDTTPVIWLPYIAVVLAFCVLIKVGFEEADPIPGLDVVIAAMLTGLVLFRQYLFVRESTRATSALTELQQRTEGIYSAANDGIGIADFHGRLLEVNDAFVRLMGYTREELIGKMSYRDFTPESFTDVTNQAIRQAKDTQQPVEYEKEFLRKDGSQFIASVTVFPIKSRDGKASALAAIIRDITERKLTEKRLREAEDRWQIALRINDDGIWDWDIRNKRNFYSPRWREMFGFDESEDIGITPRNSAEFFHPDDRHLARKLNEAIVNGEEPQFDIEFRHICKDGAYRWVRCRGEVIVNKETGHVQRVIGLNTDIELRKRSKLEREAISAIMRGVTETSNLDELLSLIHESIAKVIYAENCFVALFDKSSKLFKMQFFVDNFDEPPPPADLTGTRTQYVFRTEKPLFLDTDRTKQLEAEGEFRLVGTQPNFWLGTPLKTPNEVIGVLVVQSYDERYSYTQRDLDFLSSIAGQVALAIERKIAEEQLQVFNEKLQRSNRELQDFAYVASHDLQEPLRKVQTFADRLKTKYAASLDDNGLDYLERMRNAASRMQTLIQDLLSFSRVTTKAQPFVPVDLEQITREVMSDLEVKIEETGAVIETCGLPRIDADPLQMRQLMQNLVTNALKFRRSDVAPLIKISATNGQSNDHGPLYTITVEDNGIGFDEKYLDKIFTVFQRLHGRAEYEGSGIGLAVCRKIVERHYGSITAESKPGFGSKFIFRLPSHQAYLEID
jgi:PAS domain S-box-containing protein